MVESGDTLFSISRKFYSSSARWKEIRDANKGKIDNAAKLKPGQTLIIP
jgi:nucleoid-associated protein YgaU